MACELSLQDFGIYSQPIPDGVAMAGLSNTPSPYHNDAPIDRLAEAPVDAWDAQASAPEVSPRRGYRSCAARTRRQASILAGMIDSSFVGRANCRTGSI
jgi:hypothetical protein